MVYLAAASVNEPSVSTITVIIIAVIGSSALGAFLTGLLNRRKVSRDAEGVAVSTATELIMTLREELLRRDTAHRQDMDAIRQEVSSLRERLEVAEEKAEAADIRADKAESLGVVLAEKLEAVREELTRSKTRIIQLETIMREAGMELPPWTKITF